jgi:hypothetical protein
MKIGGQEEEEDKSNTTAFPGGASAATGTSDNATCQRSLTESLAAWQPVSSTASAAAVAAAEPDSAGAKLLSTSRQLCHLGPHLEPICYAGVQRWWLTSLRHSMKLPPACMVSIAPPAEVASNGLALCSAPAGALTRFSPQGATPSLQWTAGC